MSFASYYVAWQLQGTNTWTITDGIHTSPVTDGTLANWNTTGLATGHYNMQLIIKDNQGDSVTVSSGLNLVIGTPTTTGINQIVETDIHIYPNPGTGTLFIETGDIAVTGVNMYNSMGQLVYQSATLQNKTIDVSGLATGMYVLEVRGSNGAVRRSWVKR